MNVSIDWVAIAPELVLVATILTVFVADLIKTKDAGRLLSGLALVGTFVAFVVAVIDPANGDRTMASGTLVVDHFARTVRPILLGATLLVLLMGNSIRDRGEYLVLLLSSVLGMILLASTRDLITFFVAFELLTLPGYLLVGWRRWRSGDEAAVKYFLLGVLSTAVMIYGLTFLFGVTGTTRFSAISAAVSSGVDADLARIGVTLVLVGALFKIAAVPLHFWAPDAYQGAPIPVAAFLAVVSKGAGLVALILLIGTVAPAADDVWAPVLWGAGALSMTIANVIALRQHDIVRLLAWSSVSQAGFLLIPLAVADRYGGSFGKGIEALLVYFVLYGLATIAAFAVVLLVQRRSDSTALATYDGLFHRAPVLAIALSVALLSLAGIPPVGGWYAKFIVLKAAIDAYSAMAFALAGIAAVNTAIALAYYAAVVRRLWLPSEDSAPNGRLGPGHRVLVVGLPILLVAMGIVPGIVSAIGGGTFLGR